MTVTLSPEDVKKFTDEVDNWYHRRVQKFIQTVQAHGSSFGPIDWKQVIEYDRTHNGKEPFPSLYQTLGL